MKSDWLRTSSKVSDVLMNSKKCFCSYSQYKSQWEKCSCLIDSVIMVLISGNIFITFSKFIYFLFL